MSSNKIAYTNISSPLGEMIGGATPNGVCFLEWQDRGSVPVILQRVEKRYKCELFESDVDLYLIRLQKELDAYFAGELHQFEVARDTTGTPFEREVWKNLVEIPYGETRSYSQLAACVGRPKGMRAVGRANGANYLSILIPCHRVVEASGGLGGYGGKIWRKRKLLELESGIKPIVAD
ncbi:MAG: methylated-DNA--[protein]-cysteine S-methyltransferase [bacterium]|nr:methylated-DNA--[protein]-cysteine S-methyltransferase [bacterium]